MSLKLIPDDNNLKLISGSNFGNNCNHTPGLQDALKNGGPLKLSSKIEGNHILESRIKNWEKVQHETRMEIYKRIFGGGLPIKLSMDSKIVNSLHFRPSVLGGPLSLHEDILMNKDNTIDWEDVYKGGYEQGYDVDDFHTELEKSFFI